MDRLFTISVEYAHGDPLTTLYSQAIDLNASYDQQTDLG
jgi:hypothetical protein